LGHGTDSVVQMEGHLMQQFLSARTIPKEGGIKKKTRNKEGIDRDKEVCERESGPHADPQAENICDPPHFSVGERFLALDYRSTLNRPKTLCKKVCVHR